MGDVKDVVPKINEAQTQLASLNMSNFVTQLTDVTVLIYNCSQDTLDYISQYLNETYVFKQLLLA